MVQVDSAGPSTGGILLSTDKRRLVWDIGQFVLCQCISFHLYVKGVEASGFIWPLLKFDFHDSYPMKYA